MKQPQYPLQQLAMIKDRRLEEAEKLLKEKKEILAKEESLLAKVEAERDKVKGHRLAKLTQLREAMDSGEKTTKIQQMKQYLKLVDEQLRQKEQKVTEQKKKVTEAKKQVETARQNLLKRQQDVEKLKIHRKEWEAGVLRELERVESVEADEMGTVRHTQQKRERKKEKGS